MSHVPHELAAEFPQATAILSRLKVENAHFARLAARYHEVNRAIHRAETDVEPVADETLEGWKKERLSLLDQIAPMIAAEAS